MSMEQIPPDEINLNNAASEKVTEINEKHLEHIASIKIPVKEPQRVAKRRIST